MLYKRLTQNVPTILYQTLFLSLILMTFTLHLLNCPFINSLFQNGLKHTSTFRKNYFTLLNLLTDIIAGKYAHSVYANCYALPRGKIDNCFGTRQRKQFGRGEHFLNELFERKHWGNSSLGISNAYELTGLGKQIIFNASQKCLKHGAQYHEPLYTTTPFFNSKPVKMATLPLPCNLYLPSLIKPEAFTSDEVQLLRSMHENYFYNDRVKQFYNEKSSGRLYSSGLSLQTIPKTLRNKLLTGQFSYDIECSAPTILYQIYLRNNNTRLHELESFIHDRTAWREMLSHDLGLSIDIVKALLIPMFFGGSALNPTSKVTKQLMKDGTGHGLAFKTLNNARYHESYIRLQNDVNKLFDQVDTADVPADVNGRNKRVAYKYQKAESHILHALIKELNINNFSVLIHDGVVMPKDYSVQSFNEIAYKKTGFNVKFESEKL